MADEIRLKDGKKLYGVIVAFDDNMFKVKTDFGFVLVEKDKIASIIPNGTDGGDSAKQGDKADAAGDKTNEKREQAKTKTAETDKLNGAVKPQLPQSTPKVNVTPPALKSTPAAASGALALNTSAIAPPKPPEPPGNREEVQGNLYTNYTHGFRMYKPPSWELIDDARNALPNAIVAMGTANESTLMVVGQEKTKATVEAAAATIERRLHDVYENYRQISQRKTVVGGLPAIEYRYQGVADEHDWSGTLVVVARANDVLTVLGMTRANTDLIQIQENVIARTIASVDFSVR
jgi:hypothetical protein